MKLSTAIDCVNAGTARAMKCGFGTFVLFDGDLYREGCEDKPWNPPAHLFTRDDWELVTAPKKKKKVNDPYEIRQFGQRHEWKGQPYPRTFTEFFYRIKDELRAGSLDEFDNCGPANVHVFLYKHGVLNHTKKGTWIDIYGTPRFVLRDARKRYACATIEEAKESFKARKARQLGLYSHKISNINQALLMLDWSIREM